MPFTTNPSATSFVDLLLRSLLCDARETLTDFEDALYAALMGVGREVLRRVMVLLDERLAQDAITSGLRMKAKHGHRVISRFGAIHYERTMVQAVRNGAVRSPLGHELGLRLGFVTPSAARIAVRTAAGLSTRAATALLQALGGPTPSRTTLTRLITEFGTKLDEQRHDVLRRLSDYKAPPANAVAVAVELDGVMATLVNDRRATLRQAALDEGRKAGGPIGSEECSVGALVYFDADGDRIDTLRVARMPEPDKAGLKDDLRTLLAHAVEKRPDLVVVALSDGAPNHWTFLESLSPHYQVVDYYHATEHLQKRLNHALGVGTHATQATSKRLRTALLRPDGHVGTFRELEKIEVREGTFKPRKTTGRGAQPTFYERHHHRMNYAEMKAKNLPIGSGVIEGTARYIVVDRMRQTGMRWTRTGGQAVLDLRCAVVNGIYDQLWLALHPERALFECLMVG